MLPHRPAQRVAPTIGAVLCLFVGCAPPAADPILGVSLGMTPPQVRERFAPGAQGSFRSEAMGEDFALVWRPTGGGAILSARHEFHEGRLVAMRLSVTSDSDVADGPPLETTSLSLIARDVAEEGVAITWLARSCPTHADEVRRRMQSLP